MTETASVHVDDADAVRTITLSNPAKRNALTRSMLTALTAAVHSSSGASPPGTSPQAPDGSSPVHALVLRGDAAGGAFSSGFDIGSIDEDERERGLDPIDAPASAL